MSRARQLILVRPRYLYASAAYLLASVLDFGARVLLSDGFQVHDPAPKPVEVRSQAAAGFTGGGLDDWGGLIDIGILNKRVIRFIHRIVHKIRQNL